MMDRTTNAIAAGAITNQLWLPSLEQVSQSLSIVLTVLGIVWFCIQIYFKVTEKK